MSSRRRTKNLKGSMPAGKPWSHDENVATIDDYLDMLVKELLGESYNKAEHNRNLREKLTARSRGAIELKHPNISQALIDLQLPYIDGYKPRSHYQSSLLDIIDERLKVRPALLDLLERAATNPARNTPATTFEVFESPPFADTEARRGIREAPSRTLGVPIRIDWLAREASNAALGGSGEAFVLQVEHHRLWSAGRKRLAERIEHVSVTRGDGLGFDIHSYEPDGADRLIEVKTTRSGRCSPFFVSRSELEASRRLSHAYHLYRVFSYGANPRIFVLSGSLGSHDGLELSPTVYRVGFR